MKLFTLLFFIILSSASIADADADADTNTDVYSDEVVSDPTIRLRCENLQEEKRKKLVNKEELIQLAKKNINLRRNASYEKRTVIERLKVSYQKILDQIRSRNFDIEAMTEELVRKGCPSVNFDYLTEEYVKNFLFRTERSLQRERGLIKKKTDYTEAGLLGNTNEISTNEINEMSTLLEMDKNIKTVAINHFGMSVFNYGQSYLEDVAGVDSLSNSRTAQLGFSAYYMRETTLFNQPVSWTTYLAFANESEIEITDSTDTTQAFDAHTNLIGSVSLRTAFLKKRMGLFTYILSDQLTTLYNSDLTAPSPAAALDTRNYALVWMGAGIDTNFRLFRRTIVVSAHVATSLIANADVPALATDDFETTSGLRVGFDMSANLIGKVWGDLKYQEDIYTGLSSLSISRLTLGLTYHFF